MIDTTVDPATSCNFISSTTSASLTVQSAAAELYDQVTIPEPHTAVDIGDRARYLEFEKGAAVQFVKGNKSVTLGVRTPSSGDQRDYLQSLLDVARDIAARLN